MRSVSFSRLASLIATYGADALVVDVIAAERGSK